MKVPFLVKVNIPDLNIRSGPGSGYQRKGFVPKGVYTIVEVYGSPEDGWGRLKSGVGGICLKYCQRL